MHSKKLLLIFLFILLQLKAFSAVFVVTSNADSGPGTLRDALTQAAANGTTQIDYINFNLPDNTLTGRTITLQIKLPDLTSNLVIDGTTQPGNFFGVSHTKIRIINHFVYPQNLNTLYSSGGDSIEIYGLWLTDDGAYMYGVSSILTRGFGKLTIGAPAKGNLIETGGIGLDTGKILLFQNNICFSDTLGEKPSAGGMSVISCDNVIIGGSAAAGNMLSVILTLYFSNPVTNNLELSYNVMGTDITGTQAPYGFNLIDFTRVTIQGPYNNSGRPVDVPLYALIKHNIIADVYGFNLLQISGFGGKIIIQDNAFNTDFTGTKNFNTYSQSIADYAISCSGNTDVLIGGDGPSQKNLIAYCSDGIGYSLGDKCTISRNSIFCVGEISFIGFVGADQLPQVKINKVSNTNISGTSTPGSTIELFNADCSCYTPTPKDYFATVTADSNGKWVYNGVANGYIMASATLDSLTGYFQGAQIDDSNIKITNYTCNSSGSITGLINPYTTAKISWYNANNQLVGNSIDLKNVPAGNYTLTVDYGGSCNITKQYTIADYSIHLDTSQIVRQEPACGAANGSISGINIFSNDPSPLNYNWHDADGKVWSSFGSLNNVPAGTYTLLVSNSAGICTTTYGPITLTNTTGPNIDQSNVQVQSTICGQSAGAITNLAVSGSGTLTYTWLNSQQQTVGANKDLTGVPAGVYQLKVTDASQCGPVYTTYITIPETNGITMDESAEVTTNAACGNPTGSITGIQVTGATDYVWTDANNKIYTSSTADLENIPPGSYTLTVSNIYGCSKTSKTYAVTQPAPTQYPAYTVTQVQPCFGQSDGSLTVATDFLVKSARWVNGQNQSAGSGPTATNLSAGTYQLFFTDNNGCETLYGNYNLTDLPPLAVTTTSVATASTCGLKNGSITGLDISGGATPYNFSWTDASGNPVGTNSSQLLNLSSGTYNLTVTDSRCGILKTAYTINDNPVNIPPPSVSNIQLCSSGSALIKVNDAVSTAIYNLYNSSTSSQPIDAQTGGVFKITATNNTVFYITQINGTCESSRAEVDVSVGISAINIANTFTPNGDNINDYWVIKNIENYPDALVQVFNRYGQKLFESKGYARPFDGTYNGQKLPSGVYYYIINLSTNCNLLSGSLTIIR